MPAQLDAFLPYNPSQASHRMPQHLHILQQRQQQPRYSNRHISTAAMPAKDHASRQKTQHVFDEFDGHPFSYPYAPSTIASNGSTDDEEEDEEEEPSPTVSQPPTSSVAAPSQRSSHTSYGTAWFNDDLGFKPPSTPGHDSVLAAEASGESCTFDTNDWFAQFDGQLDVSDDAPSRENLQTAGDLPIFDSAGNSRPFKSLYSRGDVVGDRQLLVFIRHFYCGACKAYIRALVSTINAQAYFTMPIPTSIVVIGCGSPDLIRQYKATTQCPFPIFADPSRQIFKALGMGIKVIGGMGRKRPEYMKDISIGKWALDQTKEMTKVKGKKRWTGGNVFQIGGEFLFQDGEVVWCHRMKNYRNHSEMDVVKRILDVER